MNEAIKLGLVNGDVVMEIAFTWHELGCIKEMLEALRATVKVKMATCNNAEKARKLKQCAMNLKDKTEA